MSPESTTSLGRSPSPAPASAGIDAGFLRRVQVTGVVLSLLVSAFTAFYLSPIWGLGFLCASLWSVANLWVLERLLRAALRPSGRDAKVILVAASAKIPILYGLLLWMVIAGAFPAGALLTGMSLPLIVILLKVVGSLLTGGGSMASARTQSVDPS